MSKENPLIEKSLLFAARIVKLNKYLIKERAYYIQVNHSFRYLHRCQCKRSHLRHQQSGFYRKIANFT